MAGRMSADSRRIIGAEMALAVLIAGMECDAGTWDDLTSHATVDADVLTDVLAGRLRPRWRVNTEGTVTFWLETPRTTEEE